MTFHAIFEVTGTWTSVSRKAERDILSFASLPRGWHFGRGIPIPRKVISDALYIKSKMVDLGATTIEAFPKISGSIVVSAIKGEDSVDITCYGNGKYDFYVERANQELIDVSKTSFSRLAAQVRFLGWRETTWSDSFTRGTTHGRKVASIAKQFRNLKTDFLSLTIPAHDGAAVRRVNTYHYSTTPSASAASHQFFFVSAAPNSQITIYNKTQLKQETIVTS